MAVILWILAVLLGILVFLLLLGLVLLWVLVLVTALRFRRVSRAAACLLAPYIVWLTFAAYLNFGVWLLN